MCGLEDDEGSATRGAVLGAADGGDERRLRQKKAVFVRGREIDIVVAAQDDELA